MKDKNVKNKIIKVIGLITLFVIVFGLSYALFTVALNATKKVRIKTGKLELKLLDKNNNDITSGESTYIIDLSNQVPISDEEGLKQVGFEFKLENSGNVFASYTIYLDDVELEEGEERIADNYIKYSLTKNDKEVEKDLLATMGTNPNRTLDTGEIAKDEINMYTLKVWIDEDADNNAMNKVFATTLRVEGVQFVNTTPFEYGTFAYQTYKKETVKTLSAPIQDGFSKYVSETSGLYKYVDSNNTTTYVYRGTQLNNYVTFAEQTWRILNIQSDGSIKLIRQDALNYEIGNYNEGSSTANGITYITIKYSDSISSVDNVKYSTSKIKKYLDAWYEAALMNYDNKIIENAYCSDRYEDATSKGATDYWKKINPLYGMYNRVTKNSNNRYMWTPSMSCTTEDTINTKIALITADEFILAGGGNWSNSYLTRDYWYWTMSPCGYGYGYPLVYGIDNGNNFNYYNVNRPGGAVIPVITLKADVIPSSGNGKRETPYVIN